MDNNRHRPSQEPDRAAHYYEHELPSRSHTEKDLEQKEINQGARQSSNASNSLNSSEDVRNLEQNGAGWENNYSSPATTAAGKQNFQQKAKAILRKPSTLIAGGGAAVIGIGIVVFIMFTMPALLINQIAEMYTDRFGGHSETSLTIRSERVRASQFTNTACTTATKALCRYKSLSPRQIEILEKTPGIEIKTEDAMFGRKKLIELRYKNETIPASRLGTALKGSQDLRRVFANLYNPRYANIGDILAAGVLDKLGAPRAHPFDGGAKNDEDRERIMREKVNEGDTSGALDGKYRENPDESRRNDEPWVDESGNVVKDADGNPISFEEGEAYNRGIDQGSPLKEGVGDIIKNEERSSYEVLAKAEESLNGGGVLGKIKGFFSVTDVPDMGCSLFGAAQAVSYGSKKNKANQLARYAMLFLATASMIKAGDAMAEDVSYMGNILTKVVDETDEEGNTVRSKSATDSYGYRYAAYGDGGQLTDSASLFVTGATMGGKLGSVYEGIISAIGGKERVRDACGIVKNPFVQGGSLVVGVATTIFSFGIVKGGLKLVEAGVQSYAMETIGAMLVSQLKDLMSGILIDDNTFGELSGDAIASGTGVIYSNIGAMGGNAPLKPEEAVAYNQSVQKVLAQNAADDRATLSPFDASSPNTFLGQFASRLMPYTSQGTTGSSIIASSTSLVSQSLSTIASPIASAQEVSIDDYKQCDDFDYRELGLATDPFCNPIRGIPSRYLSVDPLEVATWLADNNYIDADSGMPKSGDPNGEEYAKFIKNCIEREEPLGYSGEDSQGDDGKGCFIEGDDGQNMKRAYFYLYRIDNRVLDGMDEGYADEGECFSGSTTGSSASLPGMADAATIDALIEKSEGGTPGPMHGMGATIIELSNKYGLNSNFIVATFKAETQFGTDGSPGAKYNNFGWNAENGDGDCPSIPLTINGSVRMYNCYSTPEKGIEGALKNITTNSAYKEVPSEAPPGTKEGTVAAVRNVYCPEGDGPAGDPASQCNLERFVQGANADGLALKNEDPVFLSSSGTSTPSSSTSTSTSTTSGGGAKISEQELQTQMKSYGLPEANKEEVDALKKKIESNPDALWAAQALLSGEKVAKEKGFDIKEYLTTAWIWFEGNKDWGPEPYEVNCRSNTSHPTNETCVVDADNPDKVQVAGYQMWDVQDKLAEVYNKLYSESDLQSVMTKVIENSSKASIDPWKYQPGDTEKISGATLADMYPNGDFNDERTQFLSFVLGKDPNMAAALNSYAVSDGDVVAMLKDCTSLPWSNNSYYCNPALRQEIANMMMALYLVDSGSPSKQSSCAAAAAFTTGKGLGSIVEGNTNPENNFLAEWGNGLYGYGTEYGLNGTGHSGIDIGGERGAAVYTPVSGVVRCINSFDEPSCGAFRSYQQDPGSPDSCTNFDLFDGTGRFEVELDNGDVLILGHTLTTTVKVGQRVEAGQQVATVGCMNGHHIHVEYRVPDPSLPSGWRIVDPETKLGGGAGSTLNG